MFSSEGKTFAFFLYPSPPRRGGPGLDLFSCTSPFLFLHQDFPKGYLIADPLLKRRGDLQRVILLHKIKRPFSFLNVDIENIYIQENKSHRG